MGFLCFRVFLNFSQLPCPILEFCYNLSSRASASQVMPSLDGISVFAQCQKAIDITLISLLTDIIHCVTLTTQIGFQGLMSSQMNW